MNEKIPASVTRFPEVKKLEPGQMVYMIKDGIIENVKILKSYDNDHFEVEKSDLSKIQNIHWDELFETEKEAKTKLEEGKE